MAMQSGFIKRIRDIMRMDAGINGDAQRIEQMVWMLFLKVYDAKEDDWELNEDAYESIIPEDLRWRNWAKTDSNGHAMTGDKLLNFVNNILFPVLKGNDVKDGDAVLYEGIKVTPDTPIKKAVVKSTFEDANNYMKDGVYLRQVIDVIDEIEFDDVNLKTYRCTCTVGRSRYSLFDFSYENLTNYRPVAVTCNSYAECKDCKIGGFCGGGCQLSHQIDFKKCCTYEEEDFSHFMKTLFIPYIKSKYNEVNQNERKAENRCT